MKSGLSYHFDAGFRLKTRALPGGTSLPAGQRIGGSHTGSAGQVRPPYWENIVQIQAGTGAGSNRAAASLDTPARIAMLRTQIKGLLKKIQTLRKALMEATDPKERMAIMKQIIDLQDQVRMAEAQIAELQLRARRRAQPAPESAPQPEEDDKWEDAYGPA